MSVLETNDVFILLQEMQFSVLKLYTWLGSLFKYTNSNQEIWLKYLMSE
jgi:hypothetical protein